MANPINPNFKPGVGRLATDRYDFEKHITGNDFRHNATQIDIANPSAIPGNATTVESALGFVASYIASQSGAGEGFITVGDGYDTWHAAPNAGGFAGANFDPTVPSLDTLLNPVFQSMVSGTPLNPGFARIQNGGIVVIKSGTYIVKKPIYVPAGITLLGEGYGTKIINATALNIPNTASMAPSPQTPYAVTNFALGVSNTIQVTVTPAIPNLQNDDFVNIFNGTAPIIYGTWQVNSVSSTLTTTTFTLTNSYSNGSFPAVTGYLVTTNAPVFIVSADGYRTVNDRAVDPNLLFMFSQSTQIMNMIISDNFVENPVTGDTLYTIPQNVTGITSPPSQVTRWFPAPLIQQTPGSNLVLDNVTIMGRANYNISSPPNSLATGTAILLASAWGVGSSLPGVGTPTTFGGVGGTILKINNCFIDGFAIPIIFNNPQHGYDYIEVTDSKIRAYGYYNGNSVSKSANNMITSLDASARILNNILYANATNILTYMYLSIALATPAAPLNQRGKVTFANNNLVAAQRQPSTPVTISSVAVDNTVLSSIQTWVSVMAYGNNLADQFSLDMACVNNSTFGNSGNPTTLAVAGTTLLAGLDVTGGALFNGAATFQNTATFNDGATFSSGHTVNFNGQTNANFSLNMTNNSLLSLKGEVLYNVVQVSSSPYTMDSGQITNGFDYVMLVTGTFFGPININIVSPNIASGRTIVIKDTGFASASNSITITPISGFIDGLSSYVITVPYTSITLYANGTTGSWYII